jgi:hypothetical protein
VTSAGMNVVKNRNGHSFDVPNITDEPHVLVISRPSEWVNWCSVQAHPRKLRGATSDKYIVAVLVETPLIKPYRNRAIMNGINDLAGMLATVKLPFKITSTFTMKSVLSLETYTFLKYF